MTENVEVEQTSQQSPEKVVKPRSIKILQWVYFILAILWYILGYYLALFRQESAGYNLTLTDLIPIFLLGSLFLVSSIELFLYKYQTLILSLISLIIFVGLVLKPWQLTRFVVSGQSTRELLLLTLLLIFVFISIIYIAKNIRGFKDSTNNS